MNTHEVIYRPNGYTVRFPSLAAAVQYADRVGRGYPRGTFVAQKIGSCLPPSFYNETGRDPDADRDARLDDARHFGD